MHNISVLFVATMCIELCSMHTMRLDNEVCVLTYSQWVLCLDGCVMSDFLLVRVSVIVVGVVVV